MALDRKGNVKAFKRLSAKRKAPAWTRLNVLRSALCVWLLLACAVVPRPALASEEPYALSVVPIGDVSRPVGVGGVVYLLITSPGPFELRADGCAPGTRRQVENAHGVIATVPVAVRRFDWSVTVMYTTDLGAWLARTGAGSRVYLPLVVR